MEPLHPETGEPLTNLERTLWRFRMVAHEAQVLWRGFNHYDDAAQAINEDLMFNLSNQALIIVSKFLEIWDDFGSLAKSDSRVICTRKAVQPAVDRILVWKGLEQFRNTTLAHAYVTKDGKLLPPWELTHTEQAPTYHAEIILLFQCVVFAVLAILSVFEEEYSPLDPLTGPPKEQPGFGPGIAKGTEIQPTLKKIMSQVDASLLAECGVVVKGPLLTTFANAIKP